ncbi:MAG: hypothetical protein KY467_04640 [Gemmatimonadetes bacterium]|nr:hypothetical protein [Gemmatimonadota bacterium]
MNEGRGLPAGPAERPFPRPRLLRLYCALVLLAWVGLGVGVGGSLLSLALGLPLWGVAGMLLVAPAAAGTLLLSPWLRCPHCGRCATDPGWRRPHPLGSRAGGVEGGGAVVLHVLRNRRFTCIRCGRPVRVG